MNVDLPGPHRGAQELDAARPVDQVEEDELSHVAPGEHPAREAPRFRPLFPHLQRLGLPSRARDLVPVGEALRQRGGHGRLTIAQACGPPFGVSPSRTVRKPCAS